MYCCTGNKNVCTRQNSNNSDSFVCWTVGRGVGYLLVDVLRVCDLSIRFRTFPSLRVGRVGRVDRVALLVFRRDGYGETSVRSNARMLFTRDDYADQQRNLCSDVYIFFFPVAVINMKMYIVNFPCVLGVRS